MAQHSVCRMTPADWEAVRSIYLEGIATGNATFETEAPSWEQWDAEHLDVGRLVARSSGEVIGWVALLPVSSRCAYRGVAEVSVYVARKVHGHGVGTSLLKAAIAASEEAGIWSLQAGIFPENVASMTLHTRCGFRVVGTQDLVGKLNGVWRNVVLMERRSSSVGWD